MNAAGKPSTTGGWSWLLLPALSACPGPAFFCPRCGCCIGCVFAPNEGGSSSWLLALSACPGPAFFCPVVVADSAHWELVVALVGCVFVPNEGGSSSWLHHSLANSKSRGLTRLPLLDLECVGCLMDGMVGCCSVLAFLNSHRESRLVVVFSV